MGDQGQERSQISQTQWISHKGPHKNPWPSKRLQENSDCLVGRNIESAEGTMERTKVAQRKLAPS